LSAIQLKNNSGQFNGSIYSYADTGVNVVR